MSYPPPPGQGQNPYGQNPYGQQPQQPQQQPGYGYPQQGQNPYGQPQQGANPYGQGAPQQGQQPYGYPQQGYPQQGFPQQQGMPGAGYAPGMGGQPELAHWGLRAGAALVDGLIIFVPVAILYGVGIGIGIQKPAGVIFMLLGWLAGLAMGLVFIHKEGTTGQTPGKKALGIKLLRQDSGQVLGFGMAFLRRLAHILDTAPCYIGLLWPLWDEKKQTFADKVCNTLVIKSQ
ncbi:RDD family protein [Streptomyces sp. ODS28]|uniref:RDD family protein n=1 Tax=Streptomyces sp. ODS28 TaxID=3136688 RepID=UPI0031F0E30B